ncbi:MAG: hypothetical protein P1U34_00845 [Coxiellaceae bacterium]|nr:hypothetical protein [Coxiellaceae bacterium]
MLHAIKKAAVVYNCFFYLTSNAYEEAAHGLHGLQGLQPLPAVPLVAHGLHAVALQGLHLAAQGLHLVALVVVEVAAEQGLHALQAAPAAIALVEITAATPVAIIFFLIVNLLIRGKTVGVAPRCVTRRSL